MKELLEYIQNTHNGITEKELLIKFPSISKKTLSQKLKVLLERKKIDIEINDINENIYKMKRTDNEIEEEVIKNILRINKALNVKELRIKTEIPQNLLLKLLRKMENDMIIQSFKNYKTHLKVYMLYGEKPLEDITGGIFFKDGDIDIDFVNQIRNIIYKFIEKCNPQRHDDHPTAEDIHIFIVESNILTEDISILDIRRILKVMVYDEILQELKFKDGNIGYRIINVI